MGGGCPQMKVPVYRMDDDDDDDEDEDDDNVEVFESALRCDGLW